MRRAAFAKDGVADLEALRHNAATAQRKLARGTDAFERNTGTKHPLASSSNSAKRDTGPEPLTDDQQVLWQGTISVGTPSADFTVDFDTGSSDLFLPGVDCTVNCNGHKLYDPSASSSAQGTNQPFSLAFGDGSTVQGTIFSDSVTAAGLTATGQAVGDSSQYSAGFSINEFPPDGLMGMAFQQISVFNASPFFQTLVSQGTVTAPEFGVKLAQTGSELFLGGADTSLFTGDLTNVPVTTVGFWEVNMDSVDVGGNPAVTSVDSIIDTGTTLVVGEQNTVTAIYAAIPGAADASNTAGPGFFTFPCNTTNFDVSFVFGGTSFPISLDTFNLGMLAQGSSECVGGIMGAEGLPGFIVGDVFLQNVYTVFDVGNTQVGFAALS
ncbi:acid protease [Vararia minispora EC-137]|uniref:Acid protease n=1 Tax=Vararia minispora EC-137 TaxID=1314806 RepID=A0ACB8QW96_9AGAM|nr:acid protease [Vararia minispora EC-137]